jgi:hypothetical protein
MLSEGSTMSEQNQNSLAIFEAYKIRRIYDEKKEVWYFSVIDIVAALTEQTNYQMARKYWNKLAERLKNESSEVVTKSSASYNPFHQKKPSRLSFGWQKLVMKECKRWLTRKKP